MRKKCTYTLSHLGCSNICVKPVLSIGTQSFTAHHSPTYLWTKISEVHGGSRPNR